MHVFFVPSWYPTREQPINGCFLREQALALGKFGGGTRVSVSLHGSSDYFVTPKRPLTAIRSLVRFFRAPVRRVESPAPNVIEIERRVVQWSMLLADGNSQGMLRSHALNLLDAENMHGRVDLIHAHVCFPAGWIAWQLANRFKRPYIITEHSGPFPLRPRAFLTSDGTLTERWKNVFAGSRRNVAVSPTLSRTMASYEIPRLTVIPNLVDEDRFSPVLRHRSTNEFVFFTLSHLAPEKGLDNLLEAMALAIREVPSLRLIVGGDGPMRRSLETKAGRLGISRRVTWLGAVDPGDTPDLYRNCDAFILPSRAETFGVVYVEALACGKPVIATRCGGPEAIVDEESGLLVPVGDVPKIAGAMVEMVRDPARFHPDIIRCRFLERFSRPVIVRQILALYRSVLEARQTDMTREEA